MAKTHLNNEAKLIILKKIFLTKILFFLKLIFIIN